MDEKEVVQEEIVEVKEEETIVTPEVVEEAVEKVAKDEKKVDSNFFSKLGDKLKAKMQQTKHNMAVASEIAHQFSLHAERYIKLDTGVKGMVKILLEKDAEAHTFTFLGKLNLKENTLLKDKENNMYKILSLVEGEHTRTFTAQNEEHTRVLTVYTYKEI